MFHVFLAILASIVLLCVFAVGAMLRLKSPSSAPPPPPRPPPPRPPPPRSGGPVEPKKDHLSADKCTHLNCNVVLAVNTAQHRADHERNPNPHAVVCGAAGCPACLAIWGCAAFAERLRRLTASVGHSFGHVAGEFLSRLGDQNALEPLTPVVASTPLTLRVRPVSSSSAAYSSAPGQVDVRSGAAAGVRSAAAIESATVIAPPPPTATPDLITSVHQALPGIFKGIREFNPLVAAKLAIDLRDTASLSLREAEAVTGISKSSLSRAANRSELSYKELFDRKTTRRRIDELTEKAVVDFWFRNSRQTTKLDENFERLDEYRFDQTRLWMFDTYKFESVYLDLSLNSDDDADIALELVGVDARFEKLMQEGRVVGSTTFFKLMPSNVTEGQVWGFKCPLCREGFPLRDELVAVEEAQHDQCGIDSGHAASDCPHAAADIAIIGMRNELESFLAHRERYMEFRKQYRAMCASGFLAPGEAMATVDYSPHDNVYRRLQAQEDQFSTVQAMHVVIHVGTDGGGVDRHYFDLVSPSTNDYYFTRNGMFHLFETCQQRGWTLRYIWSDGGPKHFKTTRAICTVLIESVIRFGLTTRPTWYFFPSYHGKSGCDSRAGLVKRSMKRLAKIGYTIVGAEGIVHAINTNYDVTINSRNASFFEEFDRSLPYDWYPLDAVKCWHRIQFNGKTRQMPTGAGYELEAIVSLADDADDKVVTMVAVPTYVLRAIASAPTPPVSEVPTTVAREQNKRKLAAVTAAAAVADETAALGTVEESATAIVTSRAPFTVGARVAELFDNGRWYAGTVLRVRSAYAGRFVLGKSQTKEACYSFEVRIEFDGKKEAAGGE